MTIPRNIAIIILGRPETNSCQLIVTFPSEYIVLTIRRSRLKISIPQNTPKKMDTKTLSKTVEIA